MEGNRTEIEDIQADVKKQVVDWLRDGTPVMGASDWGLRAVDCDTVT